jgi:hypothetical protein
LHSSWVGRIGALIGPTFLVLWGGYGIAVAGVQVFNGIVFTLGATLLLIVIFDFPLWCEFDDTGVTRHCLARRQHRAWADIRAIVRPASRGPVGRQRISKSGLVAEIGKRPMMLVDRIESAHEHDALERAVAVWAPGVAFRASQPAHSVAPTWLYKRRRGGQENRLVDEF